MKTDCLAIKVRSFMICLDDQKQCDISINLSAEMV